jgi:hypothetical protein
MNAFNLISLLPRRWTCNAAIIFLMLLTLVATGHAQRGKKPGHDKGKSASVSASKKKGNKSSDKRTSKRETASKKSSASRKEASKKSSSSREKKRTANVRSSGQKRSTRQGGTTSRREAPRREHPVESRSAQRAQTQPAPQPAQRVESGPADLAQQTLLGTGGDRPVRTKRSAPAIVPLTSDQLQAIAARREEIEPVSLRGYPEIERPQAVTQPFYAEGSLGIYTTAALRAGFYGTSWPYDYSLHADAGSTSGFVDNASKTSFSIGGRGGYVIGEGYGIFSGGHMGGDVDYDYSRYRRYALAAAPERTRRGWKAEANGQNSYDGTTFEIAGSYRQLTLGDTSDTRESSLDGSGKIRTQWNRLMVGGEANLRLTSLAGTSINYGALQGYAKYSTGVIALKAGGSFGVGGNSDGSTATRLAPLAEIDFYPIYGITLSAGITGGVEQNTLRDLLDVNPYTIVSPLIHHLDERIGYRAAFRFEPWQSFGLHLSGASSSYSDFAYFVQAPGALFAPAYGKATVNKVTGDFYLEMGKSDMVAAQATFMEASLDTTGERIPYVPKWDAELMYMKRFSALPITLTATARYIGSRDSVGGEMNPVALLGVKGRYAITSHFDATLELSNLINEKYQIWPGYQERGFFGAIGIGIKY